jgi:hypothetical protein
MASQKSAAERLAVVKLSLRQLEGEVDAVIAARRTAVLAGDVAGRRRCDHQLAELRLDLQAARDAIDWLPQQVQREQQQSTWPTSLPDALTALANLEPWLARMQATSKLNRSAALDQQIDHVVQRQYALRKLIERLQPQETA